MFSCTFCFCCFNLYMISNGKLGISYLWPNAIATTDGESYGDASLRPLVGVMAHEFSFCALVSWLFHRYDVICVANINEMKIRSSMVRESGYCGILGAYMVCLIHSRGRFISNFQ